MNKSTEIKTRVSRGEATLGGWYAGKQTYLWIGNKSGDFLGYISGGN
jgi:hypothetical protein